jgi:hypothetical protein
LPESTQASAPAISAKPAPNLVWRQIDPYHIVTADGRYTVCRMNRGPVVEYRAFRRGNAATKVRQEDPLIPATELGAVEVPRPRTRELEVGDRKMLDAIRAMQRVCLNHAGLT